MLDLVGNHKDRLSGDAAHLYIPSVFVKETLASTPSWSEKLIGLSGIFPIVTEQSSISAFTSGNNIRIYMTIFLFFALKHRLWLPGTL